MSSEIMSGGVTMVPRSTMSTVSSESNTSTTSSSISTSTATSGITRMESSTQQQQHTSTVREISESCERTICTSSSSSSSSRSACQEQLQMKMMSSRTNIRNKKNLRLKRRPTGVFTMEQPNPSSSASDTSDLEEQENFDETVLRNTRANEMSLFDITSGDNSINSTGKMERKQRHESPSQEQLKDQNSPSQDLEDEEKEREDDGAHDEEEEQEDEEEDEDEPELSPQEQNCRLRDQLRLKDLYIKQLEERISRLELKQSSSDALTNPVRKKNK